MVTVKITVEGLAEMVMGLWKVFNTENSATAQAVRKGKAAAAPAPPPAVPVSTALDDEDDSDEGMPGDNGEDDTVPVRKPRGRPAGAKGKAASAPAAKQPAASVATRDEIKALVRSRLREAKDQGPDEVARLNKSFAKLWKAYVDTGIFGDIPEDSDWEQIYDLVNEA